MALADAHIHLFAGGFQNASFASRPGVKIDEGECYDSLAREYGIEAALVVAYEGEDWCVGNNAHVASEIRRFDWARAAAYVALDDVPTDDQLDDLMDQEFVGVALYVFGDDAQLLDHVPARFWRWLEEHGWIVSVNSADEGWKHWRGILEQFPELTLLVSHLGLPPSVATPPTIERAAETMRFVTSLAKYPRVCVKLSGFYALTKPGYNYPHTAAWPYVQKLLETFSSDRLLWASDFSPCLDCVTFPQTIGLFQQMPFLDDDDVKRIVGANLRGLLK